MLSRSLTIFVVHFGSNGQLNGSESAHYLIAAYVPQVLRLILAETSLIEF